MYELFLTERVMMSSDQRSSLCHPTNLLGLHQSQLCRQHFAIFQDQLNFRRFPVFPGGISNSSGFPVFPGAVDTLNLELIPVKISHTFTVCKQHIKWPRTHQIESGLSWTAQPGCLTDQQVWFPVDFQETFARKFNCHVCCFVIHHTTGCLTDQQVWFPGDIFTKIQQNLQFYRHLPGRITNPRDHTDPVYPSNSSVEGHLPGTDSPNIN